MILALLFAFSLICGAAHGQSCPAECSNHGNCNNGVCECQAQYDGNDCSFHFTNISNTPLAMEHVKHSQWEYYIYENPAGIAFAVNVVQHGEGDADVYVHINDYPSNSNYLVTDRSLKSNVTLDVDPHVAGTYKIGIFGFKDTHFDIRIITTAGGVGCENDCSGRGTCNNGRCNCQEGYGPSQNCSFRVEEAKSEATQYHLGKHEGLYIHTTIMSGNVLKIDVEETHGSDVDVYANYGYFGGKYHWNSRDISINDNFTISVAEPAIGDWYIYYYAFKDSSFTTHIQTTEESCPNECSYHGRCIGATCDCAVGFVGETCDTSTVPLVENKVVDGFVEKSSWNYWVYNSATAANLIINVNHTKSDLAQDCDVYVRQETKPSLGTYDARNIMTKNITNVEVSYPGNSEWYIGVYGYKQCEYKLRVYTTVVCPNACSQHGECNAEGKCTCEEHYTGEDCSTRLNEALEIGSTVVGNVKRDENKYYVVTTNSSSLETLVKEISTSGAVWVYVSEATYPTAQIHDKADQETSAMHRIAIHKDAPLVMTYYILVHMSPFAPATAPSVDFKLAVWATPF